MAGMLTLKELQQAVGAGEIDTVVVCFPDMQGRLIGKRFQAEFFLGGAHEETHGCDYLLANDIDMEPVPGYAVANWEKGYGDFVMKPDLATLRRIPWLPGNCARAVRRARPSQPRAAKPRPAQYAAQPARIVDHHGCRQQKQGEEHDEEAGDNRQKREGRRRRDVRIFVNARESASRAPGVISHNRKERAPSRRPS